jgi:stage II sporulation protein D
MGMRRRRPSTRALAAVGILAAAGLVAAAGAPSAGAGTLSVAGTKVLVTMRGNGHGHGMSQYGARGAAIAGKTYKQIAAFYYPGTAVKTFGHTIIRVRLSNAGTNLQVRADADLVVTGVKGVLPSKGIARYRLLSNSAAGTRLQVLRTGTGAAWRTVYESLPNRAEFHRTTFAAMRLYSPDGTSTDYSGYLRAVRVSALGTGGGVMTVDRPNLENYTAGVVPAEIPTSWQRQAVDAQAVAARTYGEYAVEHPQNKEYDICDTTSCQVYAGTAQYDRSGNRLASYYPSAANDTAGQVLQYRGSTIFAQFSASNGGWTVSGGQPYLVAKADPYDNAASGDPYLYYTHTVTLAPVAAHYGLVKITKFEITVRDGHGADGGRAVSGYVTGVRSNGTSVRLATSGTELSSTLGAGTTWITMRNP